MKVYIDFDNTLVDSVTAFVSRYNQLYGKKEDPRSVTNYEFQNLNIDIEEVIHGFNSDFFFSELKLYPEAFNALRELKDADCELILITRGTHQNITKKIIWLEQHHWVKELFSDFVFTTSNQDRIKIDMLNSILIDDYRLNHLNSNARYKYAFKDIPERGWFPIPDDGVRIMSSWKLIAEDILHRLGRTEPKQASIKKTSNNNRKKNTRSNSFNNKNKKNNTKQKVVIK